MVQLPLNVSKQPGGFWNIVFQAPKNVNLLPKKTSGSFFQVFSWDPSGRIKMWKIRLLHNKSTFRKIVPLLPKKFFLTLSGTESALKKVFFKEFPLDSLASTISCDFQIPQRFSDLFCRTIKPLDLQLNKGLSYNNNNLIDPWSILKRKAIASKENWSQLLPQRWKGKKQIQTQERNTVQIYGCYCQSRKSIYLPRAY